jgi:light-regulated signal transduction histidine kinase (bacteriophytochrome)
MVAEAEFIGYTHRRVKETNECEHESAHTPGAVQGFGVLVALGKIEGSRTLTVRVVSENSRRIIGRSPDELFALDNFTDVFTPDQADDFMTYVDLVDNGGLDVQANGPEIFRLNIVLDQEGSRNLWCAMHQNRTKSGLVVCEFELENDQFYPLVSKPSLMTETSKHSPNGSLELEGALRDRTEKVQHLRVKRRARKPRGVPAAMQALNDMANIQEQLAAAVNFESLLNLLVSIVKEWTRFQRVMIYEFDQSMSQRLVTELAEPGAPQNLEDEVRMPINGIPKRNTELCRMDKVHLLYDRELDTAPLIYRSNDELNNSLDLTHACLRPAFMQLKYPTDMTVRSCITISINPFADLWGLIVCHTYGPHRARIPFSSRKICHLVSNAASINFERLLYRSYLEAGEVPASSKH